jgi:hypothetical protein
MAWQADLCRFYPNAGGTTDWVYSAFVIGYQSPALANLVDGKVYHVRSEAAGLGQWELSEGVYTASTGTFSRTTVLYNSSGSGTKQSGAGTKINFTTVPQVAVVLLAEDVRNALTANLTVYVATTGSDTANTGLSAASPFATLQKAYNFISNNFDLQGFTPTIQLADGTYTTQLVINGSPTGRPQSIAVVGNTTTPANVILDMTAADCIQVTNAFVTVSGMELRTTAGLSCIAALEGSDVTIGPGMRFGASLTGTQLYSAPGKIHLNNSYAIVGSAGYHWHVRVGGRIDTPFGGAIVITLSAGLNFANGFAGLNFAQLFIAPGTLSFAGSAATGMRFFSHFGGRIESGGLGYRGFPGNAEGLRETGGQYDSETDATDTLRGWLSGLGLSTAGATATFGVAAGAANDSTNIMMMKLVSAYTKTTAAWAVGTGNGALDTGTIAASTWYHVFLIKRPDTYVVDVLVSLSATAPTLPTGYTYFRRIGSMKTDGSSQWIKFIQDGDKFRWATPVRDINNNNPGTAAVTLVFPSLPLGVRVQADLSAALFNNNAGGGTALYLSDLSQNDVAAGALTGFTIAATNTNAAAASVVFTGAPVSIMTDVLQSIRSRVGGSTADLNVMIMVHGYNDFRGRNG